MREEPMPAQDARDAGRGQAARNAGGGQAAWDDRSAQGEPLPPLPPGLDLLWGRRGRGQRGPKPGLSVDAIVAAAIRIAHAAGLEAVSMAHVADQLGFTTMSLYRHVTSKEELLQLMWNGSAQGAEGLVITGDDWHARLRMWAMVQRSMIDQHPWITQMPMAAPPMAPNSLAFVERGLEAMDGSGLADADRLRVIGLISSYTLSEARMAHDAARAAQQAQATAAAGEPQPAWTWEELVREVADEQTYPRLHRLAWSGGVGEDPSGWDEQEEFRFGLDRILDGVAALITTRTHPTPG